VIVGDRLATGERMDPDPEQGKVGLVVTDDAWLAYGLSGLVSASGFEVITWLPDALSECAQPDHGAGKMLERFAKKATDDFRKIRGPREKKRFAVLFVGYFYSYEPPVPVMFLASNYHFPRSGHGNEFQLAERILPTSGNVVSGELLGQHRWVEQSEKSALEQLLRERRPKEALVGKSLDIIRVVADREEKKEEEKKVGKACMSIVLTRDEPLHANPVMELPALYHPDGASATTFWPMFVDCRPNGLGITIASMRLENKSRDFIPPVRRDDRCPCGSGKKYKSCHGA
jgi:hypothetical protein